MMQKRRNKRQVGSHQREREEKRAQEKKGDKDCDFMLIKSQEARGNDMSDCTSSLVCITRRRVSLEDENGSFLRLTTRLCALEDVVVLNVIVVLNLVWAMAVSVAVAWPWLSLFSWPSSLVVIFVVALDEALLLYVS